MTRFKLPLATSWICCVLDDELAEDCCLLIPTMMYLRTQFTIQIAVDAIRELTMNASPGSRPAGPILAFK